MDETLLADCPKCGHPVEVEWCETGYVRLCGDGDFVPTADVWSSAA